MTSKLTREQLLERARENVKALKMASRQTAFGSIRDELLADLQLAEYVLACLEGDSEPVADVVAWSHPTEERTCDIRWRRHDVEPGPLYRHAQQPVVPDDSDPRDAFEAAFPMPTHVQRCGAGYAVTSYGAWMANDYCVKWDGWSACRAAMLQAGSDEIGSWSNGKNTPTSTAITPAAPDKKLTDDVLDEIIAGAKTSMEQYLALSLKAERGVWRKEGPTDDERIMAIEGIHNCERCGDEGWVVGEMGITRCACGQAGNSPEIPDGYVMVPVEATEEMLIAGLEEANPLGGLIDWDASRGDCNTREQVQEIFKAMLAAAPQEVNNG